jgi:hypothetical protein
VQTAIMFSAAGIAMIAIAVFAPDFVMEGRRVRSLVALLGRTGTRVLYAFLGIVLMAAAAFTLMQEPG